MGIDIIGSNGEGFSISFICGYMKAMFEADGQEVFWEADVLKTFKHVHKNIVISTQPTALIRLLVEPFTTSPRLIMSILLSNWEEHPVWQRMAFLSSVLIGKNSSTPLVTVVHSKHSYEVILKDAREWFSPSNVQIIAKHLILEEFGIEPRFHPEGRNDPDRLIVPYNRIVESQKNLSLHIKNSRRYAVMAEQAGFKITEMAFLHAPSYNPEEMAKEKDIGLDVYSFRPQFKTREAFAEGARDFGMFMSTSLFESFGIYYLELLRSGVVGVFLDRPWIRKLLPNYRYISTGPDLPAMMLHVRKHYEEAQKHLSDEVFPFIDQNYSMVRFMDRIKALANERARPEAPPS